MASGKCCAGAGIISRGMASVAAPRRRLSRRPHHLGRKHRAGRRGRRRNRNRHRRRLNGFHRRTAENSIEERRVPELVAADIEDRPFQALCGSQLRHPAVGVDCLDFIFIGILYHGEEVVGRQHVISPRHVGSRFFSGSILLESPSSSHALVTSARLRQLIDDAEVYPMADEARFVDLSVTGMSCAACAAHVARALRNEPGIQQASVNLASETARVLYVRRGDADRVIQVVETRGKRSRTGS